MTGVLRREETQTQENERPCLRSALHGAMPTAVTAAPGNEHQQAWQKTREGGLTGSL